MMFLWERTLISSHFTFDGNNYIQHNPTIADGLDGLGSALQYLAENGINMIYNEIHYVYGYGNFVLVVSEGTFGTAEKPVPTSYYDLFSGRKWKDCRTLGCNGIYYSNI